MANDRYTVSIYRQKGRQRVRLESKVVDARDRESTSRTLRREYEKIFGGQLVVTSVPYGSYNDIVDISDARNAKAQRRRNHPSATSKPKIPVYFEVVR